MDGINYAGVTNKSVRLFNKNQYSLNVESGLTKTEIKHWVELFFGVKVIAMNSHRLPGKGKRTGRIMEHTMHYRRIIITLQRDSFIRPFILPLIKKNRLPLIKKNRLPLINKNRNT